MRYTEMYTYLTQTVQHLYYILVAILSNFVSVLCNKEQKCVHLQIEFEESTPCNFKSLRVMSDLFCLNAQSVPSRKHMIHLFYKNQSLNAVQ
jgi:hypothetical protein